jgi:hypothetical protein
MSAEEQGGGKIARIQSSEESKKTASINAEAALASAKSNKEGGLPVDDILVKDRFKTAMHAFKETRNRINYNLTGVMNVEVIVAGTRVRIDEDGFNKYKHFDVESLQNDYYPKPRGEYDEEAYTKKLIAARLLFSKIFEKNTMSSKGIPCVLGLDKQLLLEGLYNRYDRLLARVLNYRKKTQGVITVKLREMIEHLTRLKTMIDGLNTNEKCDIDYSDGDAALLLSDDRIKNIIRQFSFLLLQSMFPNRNYSEFITINPKDFVEFLEQNQIDEATMDNYLREVYQIPPIIAAVLDVIGAQGNSFEYMIDKDLDQLYKRIIDMLRQQDPSEEWKNKLYAQVQLIEGNGDRDPRLKIRDILQWIVNSWKESAQILKNFKSQVAVLETERINLETAIKDIEQKKSSYESDLTGLRKDLQMLLNKVGSKDISLSNVVTIKEMRNAIKRVSEYITNIQNELARRIKEREYILKRLNEVSAMYMDAIQDANTAQKNLNTTAGVVGGAMPELENGLHTNQAAPSLEDIKSMAETQTGGGESEEPSSLGSNTAFNDILTRVRDSMELREEDTSTLESADMACTLASFLTFFFTTFFNKSYKQKQLYMDLRNLYNKIQPNSDKESNYKCMNTLLSLLEITHSIESSDTTGSLLLTGSSSNFINSLHEYINLFKAIGQMQKQGQGQEQLSNDLQTLFSTTHPSFNPSKPQFQFSIATTSDTIEYPMILYTPEGKELSPVPKEFSIETLQAKENPIQLEQNTSYISYDSIMALTLVATQNYLQQIQETLKAQSCPIPEDLLPT